MATVRELLGRAATLPGDEARRDAEVLLCYALDKPRSWLYAWPEAEPEPAGQQRYERLLAARGRGQPVAYLTGRREFWSLSLKVDQRTLIPRPETETLVAWALELDLPTDCLALDLGTGSGAIALALAAERPGWRLTAVDSDAEALAVAGENCRELGLSRLRLLQSDWYGALAGERFHLLVSNPPYVEAGDEHLQRGDLRFEPRRALVAGADGLADIRRIVQGAAGHLFPGGWLLLEHGCEQGEAVRELLRKASFREVRTHRDAAGLERVSGGRQSC